MGTKGLFYVVLASGLASVSCTSDDPGESVGSGGTTGTGGAATAQYGTGGVAAGTGAATTTIGGTTGTVADATPGPVGGTTGTPTGGTTGTPMGGTTGTPMGGTTGTPMGGTTGTPMGGTTGTPTGGTTGTPMGGTTGTPMGGGGAGGPAGGTGGLTTGGASADTGGVGGQGPTETGGAPLGGAGGEGTTETGGGAPLGGAGGAGGDPGSTGGAPTEPTVQLDVEHQTIRGFGINTALMPGEKTVPINDLFGTEGPNAIGLSILRIGMNSDGSLTGKYVSEARAKGATIIGSTWSPPASCKTNRNTQQGGHLVSDDGGACYESWSTTIANFAEQQGLYAMSIANESDFASCASHGPPCTDDYDTTVYTAKEMVEWVKVAGPKLRAKGVKVIAPEASEWIHAWSNASATGSEVAGHPESSDPLQCGCYSNTPTETGCAQTCLDGNGYDYGHWLWADQDAWAAFDIFGVHEYDSQIAYAWPDDVNGGVRDKEVWQTEMSGVKHWPEQGPSTHIENGVAVAAWIHSALTVGEASAWLYWWYEAYYQNDNEGLALTQGSSTIAKRYYALGNFSKFVRPNFVAVEVAGPVPENVLISAYKGESGEVVVVAINKGTAAAEVPVTISGGTAPASMTPWVTSATDNLVSKTAVPVTNGVFTASLAGMSVTSFVSD